MTDLNHVVTIGRLTHDISGSNFAYTSNGSARMNFSIAVNRSTKRGEEWINEVSYFDVVYWGKGAEAIKDYIGKGKQVAVDGYLKQDRWKEKETGNNRSKIYIVANQVQLLGGKSDSNSTGGYQNGTYQSNGNSVGTFTSQADHFGDDESFPEDIPF